MQRDAWRQILNATTTINVCLVNVHNIAGPHDTEAHYMDEFPTLKALGMFC